ncbi:MAG: hypothetical protein ACKVX7_12310 [Planctomycetota bacterium]
MKRVNGATTQHFRSPQIICRIAGIVAIGIFFAAGCTDDSPSSASKPGLSDQQLEAAMRQRIEVECASASESPWLIAHGMIALGAGAELFGPNRERGVDRLAREWIKRDAEGAYVDRNGPDGRLGEQHAHLVYKTLAELSLAPELRAELKRRAVTRFRLPQDPHSWDDAAWLLEALARDPEVRADSPLGEHAVPAATLARGLLEIVESADRVVEEALKQDAGYFVRPTSESPESSGIYYYTCGGQHALQALLVASGRDWFTVDERERVGRRLDVFLRRVDAEDQFRAREYQAAVERGTSTMQARRFATLFQLKLLGHALATFARASQAGLRETELKRVVPRLRTRVFELFRILETELDPRRELWAKLRDREKSHWELWFGDSCHALDGLNLTQSFDGRK